MTRTDRRRFLVLFAAIGALIALSGALAIPATAQAQEIVLVSNIAESHSSTVNINAPDLELGGMPLAEKRAAQRFTTGPNTAGYVLQSVVLNNPADPIGDNIGTAGNRTFSAASPLSLEANTRYWVMVSNTGTNSSFSTALTNSNNQTTTHGFSIRDTHHQGPPGSWIEGSAAKVRMEVRGTVAIPPLDVTLQLSDDGDLENAPPVTVTATVSPASPVAFTVTISATPVAPATDEDFDLSANRVLRFAANATASTGTVTISTVDDDVAEPTDVVRVSGAVSNAAIPDPDDVTLTIFNDDPEAFDIAVSAPAAVDEDAGAAVVTVTLTTRKNTAPVADIGMFYRVERGGTATRGADYTPPPGDGGGSDVHYATVRPTGFSPNAAGTAWMAAPSFTIGIIDDQEAERAETIVFAVLTYDDQSPAHTITIRDNDGIGPGPPTALGAEGKSQTQIRLAWTAPAAVGSFGITGYRIEVSENAGASWHVLVANTGSAEPNKFDNGLSAGDTRHYRVSAINPAGTSARLGVASATTVAAGPAATNSALPPPQDVNAVPLLPGEIRLSWWRNPNDASHDLVDRHQYRYRVRNASTWTVDWTTVNQTQTMPPPGTAEIRNYNKVLLEGLTAATTYEFQVRSMDTDGGTSAAVSAMGTAVDRQMVWIEATTRSVEEGAPLRFAVWRDQSHGRLRVILRISETGDMLPPEGRGRTGYWHEQVYFGDGNERIPLVLDTVDDGGGTEPDSVVTVEVMPHPLYPDNPDNEHLYDVQPDVGPTKITVTAAAGGSSSGSVAEPLPEAHDGETAFTFRIVFSEAVAVTPEAMRTRVLTVAGGAVTGAARVDGETGVWAITVTPDTREALSISLPPASDCDTDGAVCTSDGRALSIGAAHIVNGPGPDTGPAPLTATFPESAYTSAQHKGPSDRPQVVVAFSAPVAAFGADTPSVSATGASVDGVQRLDKEGLENAYVFFLTPEGHQAIVFRLHANRACTDDGICTADRRQMSNSPSVTVAGPADESERNTAATGTPTISGTPQVGEQLSASTAGISDADGLDNAAFAYQWLADDAAIAGATGSTYTLVEADEGQTVKVRVSFTDDAGNEEELSSAATDAVAAPEPPAKPTGLSATPSHDRVVLTWDDPNDDTITGYVILRRNRDTDAQGQFTELAPYTGTAATTYTDDTVAAETPYTYRIKAINAHGTSERSRWFHIDTLAGPEPTQEPTPEPESVSEGDTDLPNDNSTPGRVAVGGSATGAIGTAGDQDRFAVELEVGRTYQFDLTGSPGGGGMLPDTFFRAIYNSAGQYQADSYNDDFDGGRDSRVTFTATESGTYYARVSGDRDEVGSYTLSVTDVTPQ